jgi:putative Mg2+ transporter-C (MgtC) family protein
VLSGVLSVEELAVFGKILLAALLGFVVGLERELMGSPAGDRTFSLVALGSALFTVLSIEAFGGSGDATGRVAANVVTGVGFLGGGMILKEGGTVRGLTTAAGIWSTAAVGMSVAADRYLLAILTTGLIGLVFAAERLYSVKSRRHDDEEP